MYRLLDMKGVSFDTLASKAAEVELILDYKDWDALIERIEQQEQMPEEDKQPTEENCVIREAKPVANKYTLKLSNLNLIKVLSVRIISGNDCVAGYSVYILR